MTLRVGKDELTPAVNKLLRNVSPAKRAVILRTIAFELKEVLKVGLGRELTYDGEAMRSPSKKPRADGKFAESYKWRYRPGFRHLTGGEASLLGATGAVGRRGLAPGKSFAGGELKGAVKIRRRIPVDSSSKQLDDTGGTKKSIDVLSADCNTSTVGSKTGHGNLILSVHNPTRRPVGISDKFADWAVKRAAKDALEGV